MAKVIKETVKISIAVTVTVFLTVFVLGATSGFKGKDYSAYDIPLFGKALRGTDSLGKVVGQNMPGAAPAA